MVHYIHDRNPFSEGIRQKLAKIPKTPGTCLFIDIINSTQIKYNCAIEEWGRKINNTFNFINVLNEFPGNVVKGIGDEIMLFIPDSDLRNKEGYHDHYGLFLQIYSTFYNLKNFPDRSLFLECKAGIHHCTDVYNISFLPGANDYYGSDIDLTARLMSKSKANRIVISERFFQKMRANFIRKYSASNESPFHEVSGRYIEDFKGIPESVPFRVIDV
jgi:class 3 adenylate cyclase